MKKAGSCWNDRIVLWLVFVLSVSGWSPPGRGSLVAIESASADTPAEELQADFIRVAEKVKRSVVGIRAERSGRPSPTNEEERPFPFPPPRGRGTASGTGVIVGADGIVVTNSHVIRNATTIWVIFNAERRDEEKARVLGVDSISDLAVLKVNRRGLSPIEFGDSDAIHVGAWVIAVGNPFRQSLTVTTGIVSGKGRHLEERQGARTFTSLQDYIQTDAAINPGNSGGPLVDIHGKLIGVNTAILSQTGGNMGVGFAVPVNTVKKVLPRLLRGEKIARGFLGVEYSELTHKEAQVLGLPTESGFQISRVVPQTPASEAGLQKGDIIIGYANQSADSSDAFRQLVSDSAPGTRFPLRIVRFTEEGAKELTVTVTLHERPTEDETPVPEERKSLLGMTVEDANAQNRKELGIRADLEGALITQVEPGGPADDGGLVPGFFVRKAKVGAEKNFVTIRQSRDFATLLTGIKPDMTLALWVEEPEESGGGRYVILTARSPEADRR